MAGERDVRSSTTVIFDAQGGELEGRLGAALSDVGVPALVHVTWVDVLAHHTP